MRGSGAGDRQARNKTAPPQPDGMQFGVLPDKDFKRGIKFQSEWTQSRQPLRGGSGSGSRQGVFIRVSGKVAKGEVGVTFKSQGEGLANPLMPAPGRGKYLALTDVRRTVKKHQFQYSSQRMSSGWAVNQGTRPHANLE